MKCNCKTKTKKIHCLRIDIIIPIALWRPGFDSASNRNAYQEDFLGVKAVGA